jgi:hypothetical protein
VNKVGHAFLVLICICAVPVQWYLSKKITEEEIEIDKVEIGISTV